MHTAVCWLRCLSSSIGPYWISVFVFIFVTLLLFNNVATDAVVVVVGGGGGGNGWVNGYYACFG